MPARRTYRCTDCGHSFTHLHMESAESFAGLDCPVCAEGKTAWQPGGFSISTDRSRAVDATQKIMEQDFGLTDMKDNLRPGDVAVKGPSPIQTAEAETITRELVSLGASPDIAPELKPLVQSFWQNNGQAPSMNPALNGAVARGVQNAGVGAAVARSEGLDPISLLHKARPEIRAIPATVPRR